MEFIQTHITFTFTTLILLSNIVFVAIVLLLFVHKQFRDLAYAFTEKHVVSLLFAVSLVAVIGSLSYSEIIGFVPCDLCWIQRMFMYPQAILAFIGLVKKEKSIVSYLFVLSIIGGFVALYHSLIHWRLISGSFLACTSSLTAPCAKVYVLEYGYITIPFMAFSMFVYLIAITLIYYKSKSNSVDI